MGTKYLGPGNDNFTAYKEGWWPFKKWKSWTIYGNDGNDILTGGSKNDLIDGGSGNDVLNGQGGDDFLYGQAGYDVLNGGAGNDYLDGATGTYTSDIDTFRGDAGADTFVLGVNSQINYLGSGYAVITDFIWQEGDKIKVGGSIGDYTTTSGNFGVGTSAFDTAIYRSGDLMAIVEDKSGTDVIPNYDFIT